MTERIRDFLKTRHEDGPCLVVDLDIVRENYLAFARVLPDTRVFYAVKANPSPDILKLLAELGSSFDVASVSETEAVLAAGASPERISYGNTIKKESEIARAYRLGVTLFAVDCEAEGLAVVPSVDDMQAESKIATSETTMPVSAARLITDAERICRRLRCNQTCSEK